MALGPWEILFKTHVWKKSLKKSLSKKGYGPKEIFLKNLCPKDPLVLLGVSTFENARLRRVLEPKFKGNNWEIIFKIPCLKGMLGLDKFAKGATEMRVQKGQWPRRNFSWKSVFKKLAGPLQFFYQNSQTKERQTS